ncbi:hypothetical protein CcarbDRAFT_5228 [Clostridium carboxidivorans P7]|uniref:Putative zinc-ribbon domain-containing protein n=1 Tax=Clostridium carboxidivorans P7 TaxID=536227 RepID=C6Q2G0_9CLOT|nr:zinc-ribbon domain-containing protein [Clostridium carboxidivorans]EET84324.1 hypothetical protein CcarbDRAFT_5228 [Clostridium carboxidivorans P7]
MGNLIECPMCGKMISPNAAMCPNCGEPMKKNDEQKEEHSDDKYYLLLEEPGETSLDVNNKLVDLLGISMDVAISMTKYTPYLILDDLKLEEAKDYKDKLESVGAVISIKLDKQNDYIDSLENSNIEDAENIKETQSIKDTENVEDNTIKCPTCRSTNSKKDWWFK